MIRVELQADQAFRQTDTVNKGDYRDREWVWSSTISRRRVRKSSRRAPRAFSLAGLENKHNRVKGKDMGQFPVSVCRPGSF